LASVLGWGVGVFLLVFTVTSLGLGGVFFVWGQFPFRFVLRGRLFLLGFRFRRRLRGILDVWGSIFGDTDADRGAERTVWFRQLGLWVVPVVVSLHDEIQLLARFPAIGTGLKSPTSNNLSEHSFFGLKNGVSEEFGASFELHLLWGSAEHVESSESVIGITGA
jgi:hypothetical protein